MPGKAAARLRRFMARGLISSAVLATTFAAGCRTAGVSGNVAGDPTMKTVVGPAEAAETAALPEGPGKTLVAERCMMCHSPGLITQQRKDAAAWERTVTQMRTWGTPIQDQEQATLVAYLSQHFGRR
jgi:cytochrome c5